MRLDNPVSLGSKMTHTHEDCLTYLEKIRWGGTPKCPYCSSSNCTAIKQERRYHCNNCFNSYSVTVGTLFHKSHVDLPKWFLAIELVVNSPTSITVRKLAFQLDVNKNTACYLIARIRTAITEEPELIHNIMNRKFF